MEKEPISLLEKNYIEDLKKNELDKFERCKVLKSILERNKWSQRTLAKKIGKPKSTIEDWLLFSRIDKEKYEILKEQGFNDTDIYRNLRDNREKRADKINFKKYKGSHPVVITVQIDELDEELRFSIRKFSKFISKGKTTRDTIDLVIELKTILDKIVNRAEMNN